MPKDCHIDQPSPGIDVSYYQGEIAWSRVKRAGITFAFIRAADGTEIELMTRLVAMDPLRQRWTSEISAAVMARKI